MKIVLYVILFIFFCPISIFGHGTSNISGKISFDNLNHLPGETATFQVLLKELEPNVLSNVKVFARIGRDFSNPKIEMNRIGYDRFTLSFTIEKGHYNVRIYIVRPDIEEIGMNGFTVDYSGIQLSERESELWFVPKGIFEPVPWIEHGSGVIIALLFIWALFFWSKRLQIENQASDEKKTAWLWLLPMISIAALAMPFGAFWDISSHNESGRESFFQPPHLLIYGGMLIIIISIIYGFGWKRGDSWSVYKTKNPFLFYSSIALFFQLASAPLDEFWHTFFGLDVSVWSPPHVILIFGGVFTCLFLSRIEADNDSAISQLSGILILAGALLICEVFVSEYEFQMPSWHISQSRPFWIFPAFMSLFTIVISVVANNQRKYSFPASLVVLSFIVLRLLVQLFLILLNKSSLPAFQVWIIFLIGIASVTDFLVYRKIPKKV
ncbi:MULTISPECIES: hypothetical protein [Leptospira]|uniref:hypothetical protein n=1 Tax=Leptospira TaxID=171 RepID=UPI00214C734C|nr:hypothetical protein [Leptospira sp. id769339]MCR1795723.1 hypothetical protein [Leptospira sp. id769339]